MSNYPKNNLMIKEFSDFVVISLVKVPKLLKHNFQSIS